MQLRRRQGQSSVETMLVISVMVFSLVAAAFLFYPPFKEAMEAFSSGATTVYAQPG